MNSLHSIQMPRQFGFILDVGDAQEKGDAHSWTRLDDNERLPGDGEESVTIRILWMMFWGLYVFLEFGLETKELTKYQGLSLSAWWSPP